MGYIPRSFDAKVTYLLIILGVIGVLAAVFFSLNVPAFVLKLYIGLMIFCIGVYILIKLNRKSLFSWKGFGARALLSGFNKGVSGGGYGPLVTGGQVVTGSKAKNSVGSTSLAEGIACLVGFLCYILVRGKIDWRLALPLVLGATLSTPLASLTVKKIPEKKMKLVIGLLTISLGTLTLVKYFVL